MATVVTDELGKHSIGYVSLAPRTICAPLARLMKLLG